MIARLAATLICLSPAALAQDILILGEVHDNPAHHLEQARQVAAFAPKALVFEMLTPGQMDGAALPEFDSADTLAEYLGWTGSGWPDFALYHPIFQATSEARIYGAGVPRDVASQALTDGAATLFGDEAGLYGLTQSLPVSEQAKREALQMSAHCDALPAEMLPDMVEIQRLRDASLARASLRAFRETGGPVAVITGNGHARRDWGIPAYLDRVAPDLTVTVIGQTEDDTALDGGFDQVISAPAVQRADPCAAFQ